MKFNKKSQEEARLARKHSLALALTTLVANVNADRLEGVGLRESQSFNNYKRLSMMGGAQLMLKANDGLDPDVGKNTVQFRVDDFEEDIVLQGPGLNRKYQT